METLAEKPWSWALYRDGEDLVLSVLSGGVAMVEVNVTLTPEEAAGWAAEGEAGLAALIDAIQGMQGVRDCSDTFRTVLNLEDEEMLRKITAEMGELPPSPEEGASPPPQTLGKPPG